MHPCGFGHGVILTCLPIRADHGHFCLWCQVEIVSMGIFVRYPVEFLLVRHMAGWG